MGRLIFVAVLVVSGCTKPATAPAPVPPPTRQRVVHAAAGEPVPAAVVRERDAAAQAGDRLLVYVGATWCEPCRRFHEAFESGRLDGELPHLRLLELDLDQDGERLGAAGYASEYIPMFAVPGPDGRASGRMIQGAIKGDGAVPFILPKLKELRK